MVFITICVIAISTVSLIVVHIIFNKQSYEAGYYQGVKDYHLDKIKVESYWDKRFHRQIKIIRK